MIPVYQRAHGLSLGTPVRQRTATTYAPAQANTVANAAVVGVVSRIISVNRYEIATPGEIVSGLSNLMEGRLYYLASSTAGSVTVIQPSISVPVMVGYSWSAAIVLSPTMSGSGATAGTVMLRDPTTGRAQIANPSSGQDVVNYQSMTSYVAGVLPPAFTAKGDLLVGTGAGTGTTLGVGIDGYVLTADSGQSSGLRWATAGGGGGSGGDMLQQLVNSEVALTDTTSTLTSSAFGKLHVIASTSAAQTTTLPAATGNGGKFIAFRGGIGPSANQTQIFPQYIVPVGPPTDLGIAGSPGAYRTLLWNEFLLLYCSGDRYYPVTHTHSDWQSFTPTVTATTTNPSKGTTRTENCWWRRLGHYMQISYSYEQTSAGSSGSGTYLYLIPSSFVADTTLVQTIGSLFPSGSILGHGAVSDYVTRSSGVSFQLKDSTHWVIADYASGYVGGGDMAFGNTHVSHNGFLTIPISLW